MKTNTTNAIKTGSKSLLVAGVLAAIAMPAVAANRASNTSYQYAQVVSATPVVESYRVNNPVEECWDERVRTSSQASRSRTPEILGGLIGAAIGHEFGSGRGQKVATVAGAVLGASVGHDVKNKNRSTGSTYQVVQRCEVRDSYSTHEQVVGYDVAYRFNNEVFYTQMSQHPGNRIKVQVTVTPA